MLVLFTIVVLMLIAVLASILRPVYGIASIKELQRRARLGDQIAHSLYQVSRHGLTADIFLLNAAIVAAALSFVLLTNALPDVLAFIVIAGFTFLVFVVLPKRTSRVSRKLALKISPYYAKLLVKIRPFTNVVAANIRRKRPITVHTGLYEKEDLIELLQRQKAATHNRIDATELERAARILTFSDKKVSNYMVPKQNVHFVQSEDAIGPILITELYDSGFSLFPVRNNEDTVVGTLYLKDLVEKRAGGIVSNVMSPSVQYVGESDSIETVLSLFVTTKHHLFIVRDELETVTGIITIEDVLRLIVGIPAE